jgi:hypothetical protein
MTLAEIREKFGDEYHELTLEEKDELVEALEDTRANRTLGPRITATSKIRDVSESCSVIIRTVCALLDLFPYC